MAADIEVLLPDIDVEAIDPDTRKPVTLTVREFRFLGDEFPACAGMNLLPLRVVRCAFRA